MVNEGKNPMDWSLFQVSTATETLKFVCHGLAKNAGWWHDPKTGESATANPLCFSSKLMLIVSEVAEAMEGDRKGLMDDKLPHRSMREVELADALIRICDLAGAYNLDLGGAVAEKLAFNAQRPDHKVENRVQEGGKAY
jgi:NTP pyrophosphatase (non-canonical NTP hydrolase)